MGILGPDLCYCGKYFRVGSMLLGGVISEQDLCYCGEKSGSEGDGMCVDVARENSDCIQSW